MADSETVPAASVRVPSFRVDDLPLDAPDLSFDVWEDPEDLLAVETVASRCACPRKKNGRRLFALPVAGLLSHVRAHRLSDIID